MKPRHQVSRSAIGLVKSFEGYRRSSARLADGRWTIGYGHTLTAREGVDISESDAEALLIYDLMVAGNQVCDLTFTPLTQNQFDALAAFAFGVGAENFRDSSVLRLVNEGVMLEAAQAMEAWRKSEVGGESIVVDGLIRRRAAERMLFLTPPDGFVATPGAVVRPAQDTQAAFSAPASVTVRVKDGVAIPVRQEIRPDDQSPLPMSYPPVDISAQGAPIVEERRAEPPSPAREEDALPETLYQIPDYDPAQSYDPLGIRPLSLAQLFWAFGAGLLLLVVCFGTLIAFSRTGGVWVYALASVTGLLGSLAVFATVYMIANRLDRDS